MSHLKIFLLAGFVFSFFNVTSINYDSLYISAQRLQYINTDSAKINYQRCLPYFEEQGDTLKVIEIKLKLIQIYSGGGNYLHAYDEAWELLPVLEHYHRPDMRIELYYRICSLYIIFEEFNKAELYLDKALEQTRKLEDDNKKSEHLSILYALNAWLTTKADSNFTESKKLLDLAIRENRKMNRELGIIYCRMQLAELFLMNDSLQQAERILIDLQQQTDSNYKMSHSLLFDHLGQLYMKKQEYNSAIKAFQKCIAAIDLYKKHFDNKVEVLDSLARCYHYLGMNSLAYEYQRRSKKISNDLFGSRSAINRELFEIKNTYEQQLAAQRVSIMEQTQKVLYFKTIVYVSVLILIVVFLLFWGNIKSRKIKHLKVKQTLEKKKQDCELESKNKELMTSALQMIERDVLLNEIGKKLKTEEFQSVNPHVIRELLTSLGTDKTKKWDEFELYFTQVNQEFYNTLKVKHDSLTATDLKMCALIKTGLSIKDTAEIMGISSDSVKTSRSRIRKKMGLSRNVNLIEYLSNQA